jgi:hypothetical protein
MTHGDAHAPALAHRALVAATVLGVTRLTKGLRVTVAELGAEPSPVSADLVVTTDHGHVDEQELPRAMARLAGSLRNDGDGVIALVVGSPVTRSLTATAARGDVVASMHGRDDAYARAVVWAASRGGRALLAPPLSRERLGVVGEAAAASNLTLVEPELAATSPPLARVRGMRSPRTRAIVATLALGAGARPLLFVRSGVAPKGGLARAKVERLTDGWVEAAARSHEPAAADIVTAALAVLHASNGPVSFKELLREARERWTAHARATGARATPSSKDARELAAALHQLGDAEEVTLFAVDPSRPDWALTIL